MAPTPGNVALLQKLNQANRALSVPEVEALGAMQRVSMPWKERSIVEERMRFVLRLKDGESMASLCREFGISRVTGYKIYDRYKECGLRKQPASGATERPGLTNVIASAGLDSRINPFHLVWRER